MISLIDTHIHIDAPELNKQGLSLLPEAQQCGIDRFVVPGVRVSGWAGLLDLAKNAENVYLAPGVHPAYSAQWNDAAAIQLRELTHQSKVVAVGEIGLDGTVGPAIQQQEMVLRAQLQVALDVEVPVLLHARQATGQLLSILRELEIGKRIGGIWHGFSASIQAAQELVELGFKIGVGSVLLRENARKLPDAVKMLPASALVLETDFPDMAERPEVLLKVAEKVAELRGWSLEDVAQITTENVDRLFRFQDKIIHGR